MLVIVAIVPPASTPKYCSVVNSSEDGGDNGINIDIGLAVRIDRNAHFEQAGEKSDYTAGVCHLATDRFPAIGYARRRRAL